jgi:hypothetical protein
MSLGNTAAPIVTTSSGSAANVNPPFYSPVGGGGVGIGNSPPWSIQGGSGGSPMSQSALDELLGKVPIAGIALTVSVKTITNGYIVFVNGARPADEYFCPGLDEVGERVKSLCIQSLLKDKK